MNLSTKRAKSAVAYLVKNGISSKRLTAKGFGKSMPIKVCDCGDTTGTPCSESEHQINRRTEFKIISLN